MKFRIVFLAVVLSFLQLSFLTSCSGQKARDYKAETKRRTYTYEDLSDKRFGLVSGSMADMAVKRMFPNATPVYFNSHVDIPIALENGKVDAFVNDRIQSERILRDRPSLRFLPEILYEEYYACIFSHDDQELCNAFSEELRKMKADGTFERIHNNWLRGDESAQIMPPPTENAPKGVLKCAVSPVMEPFAFIRDGEIVGYDVELAQYIAENLGYSLEVITYGLGGYIDAVVTGKVRVGIGLLAITEERKQKISFCDVCYVGEISIVVKDFSVEDREQLNDPENESWFVGFMKDLGESFERTFIRENRWELILEGLKVTIIITLLSLILGTILAFGVCAMRMSDNIFLCQFAKAYIALLQGMPIPEVLMILYYLIFAKVEIDSIIVAVIGFAMNFSAYAGETFRSGLNGIPKGQMEAALALGFSKVKSFWKVIMPQVIRTVMPVYRGEFVSMFKMTSVVGYIAIQDLTKMSDIIRSRTYEAFFPLIISAIIYFVTAHLLAAVLSYVDFRLDPKKKRHAG